MEEKTEYPYDGTIRFQITHVERDVPVTLKLRIPGWAEHAVIHVNGTTVQLGKDAAGTYQDVCLKQLNNAEVLLNLDMPVRYTVANPMVEEDSNQIAVERGPLVYCMETPDCSTETLDDLYLDPDQTFTTGEMNICGRKIGILEGEASKIIREDYDPSALYQTFRKTKREDIAVRMIPYFAWDNRGMGEMRIWMPYLQK